MGFEYPDQTELDDFSKLANSYNNIIAGYSAFLTF